MPYGLGREVTVQATFLKFFCFQVCFCPPILFINIYIYIFTVSSPVFQLQDMSTQDNKSKKMGV